MRTTDKALYAEHAAGASYRDLATKYGLNVDSVRSRASRERRRQIEPPRYVFTGDDDPPPGAQPVFTGHLRIHADELMIAGDLHIPSTNYGLTERMVAMALKHMKPPRGLLICGDLSNGDQDSAHAPLAPTISRQRELTMLEGMMSYLLTAFDLIWLTPGNHLRNRLMKTLSADMTANQIKRLFTPPGALDRVTFSWYDMVEVVSGGEEWLITHQYQYRQTKLSIGSEMAQKYQRNTVVFHQHHSATGMDKYERYGVIDCGGLHDQEMMAYVQLVPSVRPRMNSGFVYLDNGTGNLMTPYKALTNWRVWGLRAPWEPPPKRHRTPVDLPAVALVPSTKRKPRKQKQEAA
jgi:hypothetical protein